MNILLTGGYGFLGQHLYERLKEKNGVLRFRSGEYDLRSAEETVLAFRGCPEIVVHLASTVGGIGANQQSPATFFYDNMLMGLNVIHHSFLTEVKKLVMIGTVCSYPKFGVIPFREEEIWEGYPEETNAPYGVAKRALMVMLRAYYEQYGLRGFTIIPTNLYGPGDSFDDARSHVVPALIKKFVDAVETRSEEVVVWGDGFATREFLYVKDAAQVISMLVDKYDGTDPINIGSGYEVQIQELSRTIAKLTGFEGRITFDTGRPSGQPRRRVSTERLEKVIGSWKVTSLSGGLEQTIAWYKEQVHGRDNNDSQRPEASNEAVLEGVV